MEMDAPERRSPAGAGRRWRKLVFATLVVGFAALALAWWLRDEPGVDVLRAASGGGLPGRIASLAGDPLFPFGNLYLDGRSHWTGLRFAEDRAGLTNRAARAVPEIEPRVWREPFTSGPWVEHLDAPLAEMRRATESKAVETRLVVLVPEASPEHLVGFLACGAVASRVDGEGDLVQDYWFPPDDDLPAVLARRPELGPREWLSRQRWARPMARPTDVFYLNRLDRSGDVLHYTYEAWENGQGEDLAVVGCAAGQWAVAARGDGAIACLRSYYSGQSIPPLMDALVERMTSSFYENLVDVVQEEVVDWTPDERIAGWLERAGLRLGPAGEPASEPLRAGERSEG